MIKKATKQHIPAIYDLVLELAIFEKAAHELTATIEDYYNDFKEGIFEAIVLEEKGEVIGMCLYYMTYSTWKGKMLYLEDFVVKQKHRKKGYGQKLFEAFIDIAKEKKCRLAKWQVLDWNESAINFYKKK